MSHQPDVIVGVATAGIPHAALLAQHLRMPMAYVRSKAKGYGLQRQIEGKLATGQRTIIIEDLVFTGSSSLHVVDVVRRATGRKPEAVLCIFTYGVPGVSRKFMTAGTPVEALCNLDSLLEVARDQSVLSPQQVEALKSFQQDPWTWSKKVAS